MNWIKKISKVVFFLLLLIIATLSLLPPENMELHSNDKVGHALAYACLFTAYCVWKSSNLNMIIGFLFCSLFGMSLEGLQSFVPGREPSLMDVFANMLGLMVSGLIISLLKRRHLKVFS